MASNACLGLSIYQIYIEYQTDPLDRPPRQARTEGGGADTGWVERNEGCRVTRRGSEGVMRGIGGLDWGFRWKIVVAMLGMVWYDGGLMRRLVHATEAGEAGSAAD